MVISTTHGNCHIIVSQTLTSVISHAAVFNKSHLLRKVSEFCLKSTHLGWVFNVTCFISQYPPYGYIICILKIDI